MSEIKWSIYLESTGAWEATTDESGVYASHQEAWSECERRNLLARQEEERPERERRMRFETGLARIVGAEKAAYCLTMARSIRDRTDA